MMGSRLRMEMVVVQVVELRKDGFVVILTYSKVCPGVGKYDCD